MIGSKVDREMSYARRFYPVGSDVFFRSGDRRVGAKVVGHFAGSFAAFLRVEVVNPKSKHGKWPHMVRVDAAEGGPS